MGRPGEVGLPLPWRRAARDARRVMEERRIEWRAGEWLAAAAVLYDEQLGQGVTLETGQSHALKTRDPPGESRQKTAPTETPTYPVPMTRIATSPFHSVHVEGSGRGQVGALFYLP